MDGMKKLPERFKLNLNGKANPECIVQGEKYRFTILTSQMIRMEYSEEGIFEDRATQVVWNRNFDTPNFTVFEQEDRLEIDTEYFHLVYDKKESRLRDSPRASGLQSNNFLSASCASLRAKRVFNF